MKKNTAGQKLTVFAFDATTGLPKTGDAANLTAYVSKDSGSLTTLADTSASEVSSSNAAGYYRFDLAQAETNADKLEFTAKSSTADVVVVAVPAVVDTVAAAPFAARGVVMASPSPTRTAFRLTGVSGSRFAARKTLFIESMAGEGVAVESITLNGSDWDVVLAGTGLQTAPASGDVAQIYGYPTPPDTATATVAASPSPTSTGFTIQDLSGGVSTKSYARLASGAMKGQARPVTGVSGSAITVSPAFPSAPAAGVLVEFVGYKP